MPGFRSDEEEEDPTFDEVSGMADRLGLQGKARAAYIDDHMTGLGYEAIQSRESYVRPKRNDGDGGQGQGFGQRWGFNRGGGQGQGGGGGKPPRRQDDDTF